MLRTILALLICSLLCACAKFAPQNATEHAPDAGAKGYLELTLYRPDESGRMLAEQKRLPMQSDMASYALSFVLDDPAVSYRVAMRDGRANVDIASFPAYADASAEKAAVAGIVNTLLAMRNVREVALTFDKAQKETLPHGTDVSSVFCAPLAMDAAK